LGDLISLKDWAAKAKEAKEAKDPSEPLYPILFLTPTQWDILLENQTLPAILFLTEEEIDALPQTIPDPNELKKEKRALSVAALLWSKLPKK
jgi:hypothetical protein